MRNARFKMYFIAACSVVPFGNHPKSDVNRSCLFINLQVIKAVVSEILFVFWGFMKFNVFYSRVSERIQYITRRKDQKNENYLLDSLSRTGQSNVAISLVLPHMYNICIQLQRLQFTSVEDLQNSVKMCYTHQSISVLEYYNRSPIGGYKLAGLDCCVDRWSRDWFMAPLVNSRTVQRYSHRVT